jgi:3-dehydrosphinganine reductase
MFAGQRVFITGGSSGIGKATATMLSEAGAHVCIAARTQAPLDATVAELRARAGGGRVDGLVLDVADAAAVERARDGVLAALGGLDLLINNAGVAHPARAHEMPLAVYRQMMDVNYFGVVHTTKAFLEHFRSERRGHIAAVSSLAGFLGVYGYSAYAASKFAIVGFMDALRQELKAFDVGVTVLFPGDTDTPQLAQENLIKPPETKAIGGAMKPASPDSVAQALLAGIAQRRYHVLPGAAMKLTWMLQRHAPALARSLIDKSLEDYQRREGVS